MEELETLSNRWIYSFFIYYRLYRASTDSSRYEQENTSKVNLINTPVLNEGFDVDDGSYLHYHSGRYF